jgi:hypothetical protein
MALPQVIAGLFTRRLASGAGFSPGSFVAPFQGVLQGFISTSTQAAASSTAAKKVAAGKHEG